MLQRQSYEWNFAAQMVRPARRGHRGADRKALHAELFSEEFLIERPACKRYVRENGARCC